jgi:DNA-binding GntR family transcriptional regulator
MTESGRVYKELKQDVITCVLSPGLSVSEAELCSRYQASRTPIREACRKLSEEGLMQIVPFRGYTITPLTIEEYRNLYEVQASLDPMMAALAAERATAEQLKEIEFWASYEYHAGQKSSYYTFLEWNKQFHLAIAAATQNQVLVEMASNMQVRLMRYFYLVIIMDSYGAQLVKEHREMVKAIRSGNAQRASERAAEHVTNTASRTAAIDVRSATMPASAITGSAGWVLQTHNKVRRRAKKTTEAKLTSV